MSDCKRCHWLKRLLCLLACPAVNDALEKAEVEK
jgi:hypothetical protein